jgi:hypothetical protein
LNIDNDAAIGRINRMMNKNKFPTLMAMEILDSRGSAIKIVTAGELLKTEIDQPMKKAFDTFI